MKLGGRLATRLLGGAAIVALASISGIAHAQASQTFDIPSQPLASALRAFGVQSGQPVLYGAELAEAKESSGVAIESDPESALAQLLAGTGLTYRRDGETFLIVEADMTPLSAAISLPPRPHRVEETVSGSAVEGLVVTAQKRRENIQDVPIAISAFTQDKLEVSQIAGGPDLMTQVPNMTFTKTNFASYSIQIRGIGTQAISATTDPAVAVAFNNTPFIQNRFFEQEFYDLERVEVLRGPQGTLYGRNATAGVVNVISAKPGFEYETKASIDLSNYDSRRLEGMVNFPLIDDKLALRIAGAWTKRDGFVKNILTGEQTDGRDLWSTRMTLGMAPAENLSVNLIWEHFEERDDRLRSGKQLCHSDPGPSEVNGKPVTPSGSAIEFATSYVSQGCLPASLYGEESFDTPNGFALPYYGAAAQGLGSPVFVGLNPYVNTFQSRDLREIETHLTPEYEASTDLLELQANLDLPHNLSLTSETGYTRDRIFSFEDFNRFDTRPGVFKPGGLSGDQFDLVDENGFFCDPQLGCTNRLAAGDLSTAQSKQFSQEFRLASDFDGPFNFSLGANFLRFDTEAKFYVFINSLTAIPAVYNNPWVPGVSDNSSCTAHNFYGPIIANPNISYDVEPCAYIDPNDIHHLNDQGRNYFLSKNPYSLLSYAAFGEVYYNITPDLKLTGGLRWTVDKKQAPQVPSWLLANGHYRTGGVLTTGTFGTPTRKVIELEWNEPTGRIALDWKPDLAFTDDTLIYASYVRGYKAGGANPPPPVVSLVGEVCPVRCGDIPEIDSGIIQASLAHPETFDAEFVDAFELGAKNTLLDGRLTLNLSGFYYDYEGYQISQIVNRSAVNLNFDATVKGLELEADWQPLENLRFSFKGGYEDTQMADGSQAIDLMDRTAGTPGWIIFRPMPPQSANCVVPEALVTYATFTFVCSAYVLGLDPVTVMPYVPNPTQMRNFSGQIVPLPPELAGYPGWDPTAANHGEGFLKDLSGNELPNAPKYTATITADYTLPLGEDWLMTLHTDLYYQSEAWTRIFNTDGYDKLKAYNNINFAAIFNNEDNGWNIMAYVKNVLDRDSITGTFLNAEDTGLPTNVFLTEPRLYGVRVSKNWSGIPFWKSQVDGASAHEPGKPYLFTVEVGEQIQRTDHDSDGVIPYAEAFSSALDPSTVYHHDLGWTDGVEAKLAYRPGGGALKVSAGVRYGRTDVRSASMRAEEIAGPEVCRFFSDAEGPPIAPDAFRVLAKLRCDPDYGPVDYTVHYPDGDVTRTLENKYNPDFMLAPTNRIGASARYQEDHLLVDFAVGKDFGLGLGEDQSSLSAGVRYGEFKSTFAGDMRGISDMTLPDGWSKYNATFDQYAATFEGEREFKGAGPILSWEAAKRLWGDEETGSVNVDWTTTGGVLFGKQKTTLEGIQGVQHFDAIYPSPNYNLNDLPPPVQTPFSTRRVTSSTVPIVDVSFGLSYEVSNFKFSTGYRWERYFNVLDGGYQQHKSYDRTLDGPYLKMAIGFGG